MEGRRGFTLIELVVSSILIAMVTGAVTVALSQSLRAQAAAEARQAAMRRAQAAAEQIARDVRAVVREGDLFQARLLLTDGAPGDELLLFTTSYRAARPTSDRAEGGRYEVQYRLASGAMEAAAFGSGGGLTLFRRVDPQPDDTPAGGGVVFPVIDGITSLSIDAHDGEQWLPAWDSDFEGYPHAVRIRVTARSDNGSRTAAALRTVPIDRVPLPFVQVRVDQGGASEGGTP
jgi:prepilin-type N-terminal cleavage/methylation domain-containing protein